MKNKVLVFVGTEGTSHDHSSQGRFLADMLSVLPEIEADFSRDYEILAGGLAQYRTTLFYTDLGELSQAQEDGLLTFIRGGGGFVGLHTADASFRDNTRYHGMLNGLFNGHSPYMDFTVQIVDHDDPVTRGLADFDVKDELHYLKNHDPTSSHYLMQAYDPTTGDTHVMAYRHTYDAGRVFFFALGHDRNVLEEPPVQEIIRRGVLWSGNWI